MALTWAFGGAEGIRTPDPLDANEVRYRTAPQPLGMTPVNDSIWTPPVPNRNRSAADRPPLLREVIVLCLLRWRKRDRTGRVESA